MSSNVLFYCPGTGLPAWTANTPSHTRENAGVIMALGQDGKGQKE